MKRNEDVLRDFSDVDYQSTLTKVDGDNNDIESFGKKEQDIVAQITSTTHDKGDILNQLKITNILELSKQQTKIIEKVKQFMQQQEKELINQIESIQ